MKDEKDKLILDDSSLLATYEHYKKIAKSKKPSVKLVVKTK